MEKKEVSFFEQRAIHLAIMHLTRRDDLVVTQPETDYGVDLLVEISQEHKATGRMFGVQVKTSQRMTMTSDNASGHPDVTFDLELPSIPDDLPFPLCLFLFRMDNDAGYVRWLKAPIVNDEGMPKLGHKQENLFKFLTKDELDALVEQVNIWYEKRRTFEYQEEAYA